MFVYYNQIINSSLHSLTNTDSFNKKIEKHSYFSWVLMYELLLMCIFPWPFYETYILSEYIDDKTEVNIVAEYFLGDYFLAIMFLRVLFVYRSVLNYSTYTDAISKKLCSEYGFTNGNKFALKCLLTVYPFTLVMCTFVLFTLIAAYLLRIFELPLLKHEA